MLPFITIWGFSISTFQVLIAIGAGLAVWIFFINIKKFKITKQETIDMLPLFAVMIISGLLFAMISDKIAHWGEDVWYKPAGISFSGGMLGATLTSLLLYNKIVPVASRDIFKHMQLFIAPLLIAHAMGRVGCFCAGCCYGIESDSWLAVTFPEGSLQHIQMGYVTSVLPTQLFEAVFLLLMFVIILLFVKKYIVPTYFFAYGVGRFLLEFLRADNRGSTGISLSPSQLLSIVFVIFGSIYLYFEIKHRKKQINDH